MKPKTKTSPPNAHIVDSLLLQNRVPVLRVCGCVCVAACVSCDIGFHLLIDNPQISRACLSLRCDTIITSIPPAYIPSSFRLFVSSVVVPTLSSRISSHRNASHRHRSAEPNPFSQQQIRTYQNTHSFHMVHMIEIVRQGKVDFPQMIVSVPTYSQNQRRQSGHLGECNAGIPIPEQSAPAFWPTWSINNNIACGGDGIPFRAAAVVVSWCSKLFFLFRLHCRVRQAGDFSTRVRPSSMLVFVSVRVCEFHRLDGEI